MAPLRRAAALGFVTCLAFAFASVHATAQVPEHSTNLKVLPQNIDRDELVKIMGSFTRALGVSCTHCHVAASGRRPAPAEFALDTKETKQVARAMLRMVDDINNHHLPATGRDPAKLQRVSCASCHGGLPKPRPLEGVLVDCFATGGLEAAVKQYRTLRQEYFGKRAYDFSDITLVTAADEIGETEKNLPDAVALMRLNLEFHPDSWFTYQEMGQLQERIGDATAALASYRKALEINPDRGYVKELLQALEAKLQTKP